MATTQFKLTGRGLIRRVNFSSQPSWNTLSHRIHTLFGIPIEQVGVSYVDSDNDEITISSESELIDYYQSVSASDVVKFSVRDLSANNEKSLPATPRTSGFRDTFGNPGKEGLPFDIEADWQRIPSLDGIFLSAAAADSDSPHAFIQVVDSDVSINDAAEQESIGHSSISTTDFGDIKLTSTMDKGKGKAIYVSPPLSVASQEEPILFETQDTPSSTGTATPVAHPDPVLETATPHRAAETVHNAAVEDPTDPPLPTIDPIPQASLSNDVATLLSNLQNVLSSHPELSEGLRNIVQSATNGAYWSSHRASISQAAGEFMETTRNSAQERRRQAEEEAGRRVAEAMGGLIRSFSEVLGGGVSNAPADTSAEAPGEPLRTSTPTGDQDFPFWSGPGHWRGRGGGRGGHGRRGSWGGPYLHSPFYPRPPFPPPPPPHGLHPWATWAAPPGPPPPAHGPPPPVPPPPPMGPPQVPPHVTDPTAAAQASTNAKPTPQELRAQVEAAKSLYKAEKERYRAEREERRMAREVRLTDLEAAPTTAEHSALNRTTDAPAAKPAVHLVSTGNPRVGYPPLEMYSIPHRSNTYNGRPTRRHEVVVETPAERSLHRITKRLAAMGITDKAHPSLPAKIKEQLPPEGTVSEDAENNIVSTLVEELLFMSPKPAASGSGMRDTELPGAWP
ncbi:F-box domain-containing protein [Favolaschia claudopus]|uniref:F-box domain-containing protein n=1 Tax=Favolaschia claudopus TaxID=2862362 RepID=A0AAW0EFB2_9AGAR